MCTADSFDASDDVNVLVKSLPFEVAQDSWGFYAAVDVLLVLSLLVLFVVLVGCVEKAGVKTVEREYLQELYNVSMYVMRNYNFLALPQVTIDTRYLRPG